MRSVQRPLRAIAAAVFALLLTLSPGLAAGGAADGLDPVTSAEEGDEALIPVSFSLDVVGAERVQLRALIASVSQRYGVDDALMMRIAECESGLNPRVTGPDGAAGLFQVIPGTWEWVTERLELAGASPHDPVANIEVAAWLLANLGPREWGCQ